MTPTLRRRPRGYTLLEMLTASVIIGAAMSAGLSLAGTLKMQEEMSWRATIASNYLETYCRLWQLGQTPTDITTFILPGIVGNRTLNDCLDTGITTGAIATSNKAGLGVLEGITTSVSMANYTSTPAGATSSFQVYRPVTRGVTTP